MQGRLASLPVRRWLAQLHRQQRLLSIATTLHKQPSSTPPSPPTPPASATKSGNPSTAAADQAAPDFYQLVQQLRVTSQQQRAPLPEDQMMRQPVAHRVAAPPGKGLDRAREAQPAKLTPQDMVPGKLNASQLRSLLQQLGAAGPQASGHHNRHSTSEPNAATNSNGPSTNTSSTLPQSQQQLVASLAQQWQVPVEALHAILQHCQLPQGKPVDDD